MKTHMPKAALNGVTQKNWVGSGCLTVSFHGVCARDESRPGVDQFDVRLGRTFDRHREDAGSCFVRVYVEFV